MMKFVKFGPIIFLCDNTRLTSANGSIAMRGLLFGTSPTALRFTAY